MIRSAKRVDTYIAGIPGQERAFRRQLIRSCQRCGEVVGAGRLALVLWPVVRSGTKVTDAYRRSAGRARLCKVCVAETRPIVRVPARG